MGRLSERKPFTKLTATVLLVLATVTVTVRSQTPSTQLSCMSAFVSLLPCVGYVTGTNDTAPSACCNGFVAVIVNNAGSCLCQFLSTANPLGVPVEQKKALELPAACNVNISSLATQCTAIGVPLNPVSPAPSISVAAPAPHTPHLTIPGPSFVPPTANPVVPPLNVPSPLSAPNVAPSGPSGDSTLGPEASISSDGLRNNAPTSTINNFPSTDTSAVTSANGASRMVLTRWTSGRFMLGIILAYPFIL